MPLIKSINNITPKILEGVFLADNAVVVGDVIIGKESSVWFNTVIRGDVNSIIIWNSVNIQDGVVVHCTYQKTKTIIGDNVSIGHNAIIHGCEIRNNVLIGMGAIIMDNVIIEENSIIAAGAVLTKGTYVKSGSLFAGVPAKFKRSLFEEEIKSSIIKNYLNDEKLDEINVLVLACTHYPLIQNEIKSFYNEIDVIDSSEIVAEHINKELSELNLLNRVNKPKFNFIISNFTESFSKSANIFFKENISLEENDIWKSN